MPPLVIPASHMRELVGGPAVLLPTQLSANPPQKVVEVDPLGSLPLIWDTQNLRFLVSAWYKPAFAPNWGFEE